MRPDRACRCVCALKNAAAAYTAGEETTYYFDVQYEALERALDMFAAFFSCPLFTPSATDRELVTLFFFSFLFFLFSILFFILFYFLKFFVF